MTCEADTVYEQNLCVVWNHFIRLKQCMRLAADNSGTKNKLQGQTMRHQDAQRRWGQRYGERIFPPYPTTGCGASWSPPVGSITFICRVLYYYMHKLHVYRKVYQWHHRDISIRGWYGSTAKALYQSWRHIASPQSQLGWHVFLLPHCFSRLWRQQHSRSEVNCCREWSYLETRLATST